MTPEVRKFAEAFYAGLDCPRALTAAIMLRYDSWDDLTQLRADPSHHLTSDSFRRAHAASELLRKFPGLPLTGQDGKPLDLRREAVIKWLWAEAECFKTNRRFTSVIFGCHLGSRDDGALFQVLERVRRKVHTWLGPRPPEHVELRFGPGATVTDKSSEATVLHKMSTDPSITHNAWSWLVPWIGTQWASSCADLKRQPVFVRGNRFFTVPKDSRSLRSCGLEPSINVSYQLALGRALRRCLQRAGIDLAKGKDIHMDWARRASLTGSFATIDLTSASDCLASEVVRYLLPRQWHSALSELRSPFTQVEGKQYRLEKFSSMGNGFTFELETLIFLAIASVCSELSTGSGHPAIDVSTYGDDIIVPAPAANLCVQALKFFGFTPNLRKTYVSGNFKESCGGDFFKGQAVRPYYLDDEPSSPTAWISIANGVRRMMTLQGRHDVFQHLLRRCWFIAQDQIPVTMRACRGPDALGDLVIHDDQANWTIRWRSSGIRWLRVVRPSSWDLIPWEGFGYTTQLAALCYGIRVKRVMSRGKETLWVIPRDGVLGYKLGWAPFS